MNKPIDYSKVDWSMHDAAIARLLGVTRPAVGRARKKAKAPPSKRPIIIRQPTKRERHRMAMECCRMLAKLDDMGMDDVLPQWMQSSWDKIVDLAKMAATEAK